jgi:Zn ribbon nucleic-acid-binding protein
MSESLEFICPECDTVQDINFVDDDPVEDQCCVKCQELFNVDLWDVFEPPDMWDEDTIDEFEGGFYEENLDEDDDFEDEDIEDEDYINKHLQNKLDI